jgi:hypothetical protein
MSPKLNQPSVQLISTLLVGRLHLRSCRRVEHTSQISFVKYANNARLVSCEPPNTGTYFSQRAYGFDGNHTSHIDPLTIHFCDIRVSTWKNRLHCFKGKIHLPFLSLPSFYTTSLLKRQHRCPQALLGVLYTAVDFEDRYQERHSYIEFNIN